MRPAGSGSSKKPRVVCHSCKKYQTVSKPYIKPNSAKALDENFIFNERVHFLYIESFFKSLLTFRYLFNQID